ncbi:MAG: T9SS type A sorting domain-containing protein [Bacteroidetes bacterium]|nr:T9SS type A sorting domain-containing protein [Bacteroidota bacterium]
MKKILYTLVIALAFQKNYGQSPLGNKAVIDGSYGAALMASCGTNYFYTAAPYLYSVTKTGQTRFKTTISTRFVADFTDLQTTNHYLLLSSVVSNCDVGSPWVVVSKIDTMGTIIFQDSIATPSTSVAKIAPYQDSSFFVFTKDTLFHFSKNGVFLSKKHISFGITSSVYTLANGHFLVSASQGSAYFLYEVDANAAVVYQQSVSDLFSKISPSFGLSTAGFVAKINSAMQVVSTTQAAQGSSFLSDFDVRQDTLYTCGKNGNQLVYLKLDTATLQNRYQFTSVFPNIIPSQISATNHQVSFLAKERANSSTNTYISFTAANGNTSFSYPDEAAVVKLGADGYIKYWNPPGAPSYIFEQDIYYKLKATVKNYGTDTLRSVYINHKPNIPPGFTCGTSFYGKRFDSLRIAPNDTLTLTTDLINAFVQNVSNPDTTTVLTMTLCAWTSVPNDKSDNNHADDYFCGSVSFNHAIIVTGIPHFMAGNNAISVYPNPTTSSINIQGSASLGTVEVYNTLGQLISQQNTKENTLQIDLSKQSEGIYMVRVGSQYIKVLKQ